MDKLGFSRDLGGLIELSNLYDGCRLYTSNVEEEPKAVNCDTQQAVDLNSPDATHYSFEGAVEKVGLTENGVQLLINLATELAPNLHTLNEFFKESDDQEFSKHLNWCIFEVYRVMKDCGYVGDC